MFALERDLNAQESVWVAQAMVKVSAVDGVDQRERDLIDAFLSDIGSEATFEQLLERDFDPLAAKEALLPEVRITLIEGCWMVAFADGSVSEEEKQLISRYAEALEVTELEDIRARVLDHLMQGLSHIRNIDALAEINQKLGA